MCASCGEAWKDLPGLGRQAVTHIFVSLPNLWQAFQETNHPFVTSTTTIKEFSHFLHWLAHANSNSELATVSVGKSTVVAIAHEGLAILWERLVPEAITFLTGRKQDQVMVYFEALCGLPCCGGALDSSFMPIKKPADFGDTYILRPSLYWHVWMEEAFSHTLMLVDQVPLAIHTHIGIVWCVKKLLVVSGLHIYPGPLKEWVWRLLLWLIRSFLLSLHASSTTRLVSLPTGAASIIAWSTQGEWWRKHLAGWRDGGRLWTVGVWWMTQYLPDMCLWFAVHFTMSVKGITMHLSLAGFKKNVLTLKPRQLFCK